MSRPFFSHRFALALVGLATLLPAAACVTPDDSTEASVAKPGYDMDEDPALLDGYAGKADHDICHDYPGGELSGDDLLVLVNKQDGQQLSEDWEPLDIGALDTSLLMPGREGSLRKPVIDELERMFQAARDVDLELRVRSAYRSYRTQCFTFDYKVKTHGLEHAKRFSAEPGRSQHQLGTTVDITSQSLGWSLSQGMGHALEGQWLAENAHLFGFALSYPEGHEEQTGYAYEPWHFRYVGVAAANEMHGAGLILEEYLQRCQAGDAALACEREVFPAPIANEGFIGGSCARDADCSSIGDDAYCQLDVHAEGHCTLPCDLYCPDRAGLSSPTFCAADANGAGLCHSKCDTGVYPESDDGCREGFRCAEAQRPNGSASAMVCVPEG